MIPATALAYLKALEEAMAKPPTPYDKLKAMVKAQGRAVAIGGSYEEIAEANSRMKIKPKRKPPGQTLNQQYASKNRKRYKGVSK